MCGAFDGVVYMNGICAVCAVCYMCGTYVVSCFLLTQLSVWCV